MALAMAILCGLTSWPAAAEATLITIEIEGVVDSVWDEGNYLEGKIKRGDIINGTYIYNSDTPDSAEEPWLGKYEYFQDPYGIILEVRGFRFETDPTNVTFNIYVSNDRISPSGDIYNIVSNNNLPLSSGTPVTSIWWQLNDNTGSALLSDALPTTAPVLDNWQANVLDISGYRTFGIQGHVISAIPEPATILLFGLGTFLLRKRT